MTQQIKKNITVNLYWLSTWLVFLWGVNYLLVDINYLHNPTFDFTSILLIIFILVMGVGSVVISFGLRKMRLWALYAYSGFVAILLGTFVIKVVFSGISAATATSINSFLSFVLLIYYWKKYRLYKSSKMVKIGRFELGFGHTKRPLLITTFAVLGVIFSIIQIIVHFATIYSSWYSLFLLLVNLIEFVGFIFLWKMRKWSFYVLGAAFIVQPLVANIFLHIPILNPIGLYFGVLLVVVPLFLAK